MNKGLTRLRIVAVWVLGSIVNVAMVVSFVESYHGLYLWAIRHKVRGVFAYSWPVMVDAFLLSGEIVLLTAAIGDWSKRTRLLGWSMALGGLTASVLANAGQVGAHAALTDHITGAVPPVAAMASMIAAISIIKQTVATAELDAEIPDTAEAEPIEEPIRVFELIDPLDDEIEMLNELPSHAAKVRAAINVLSLDAQPAELNQWLKERDQEIPMASINATMSRVRSKAKAAQEDGQEVAPKRSEGLADAAIQAEPKPAAVEPGDIPPGQRRLVRA